MKHSKTIELDEVTLLITFEETALHKEHPAPPFIYEIIFIPKHKITERKMQRLLMKYNLKLLDIWCKDVFAYTTHHLGQHETDTQTQYRMKGEKVVAARIIHTSVTLPPGGMVE